jgi:hypothetical protein
MRPVSGSAGGSFVRLGRALVATALCAQLAHAVIYGSVFPAGGAHHYLSWYVPLVLVLSAGALALVPISIATRVLTKGRISVASFLPHRDPGNPLGDVGRLALSSALLLLVQESIERTVVAGDLHVATSSPLTVIVAVVVLVFGAATVVAVERTLDGLGEPARPTERAYVTRGARWSATVARVARRRPQSRHGSLRAPPLTV